MEANTATAALERELTFNLHYALEDGETLDTTGTIQLEYLESSFDGCFPRPSDWKHFCNKLEEEGAIYFFMRWNKKHKQGIRMFSGATLYFDCPTAEHGLKYNHIRVIFDNPREVVVAHVADNPVIMPINGFEAEIRYNFYFNRTSNFATAADLFCNVTKLL